ncbi:MAG: Nif3-like dinuclear metal center hexameric protein, partial [Myxococcales bacterium]
YPPHRADSWDSVGLVCGDPADDVRRILLAVDPVLDVAAEAREWEADLVIVHHPLFLKGTSSVAASTPKGRVVHDLLTSGCALYTAHTNADAPADGVSESIALALGLVDPEPLDADALEPTDKLVVFVPVESADEVRAAMTGAGAGAIGDYDSCTFTSTGQGRFRPLAGANPTIGTVGDVATVDEVRIEAVCARGRRSAVLAAMLAAHPYEEPAYDVIELAELDDRTRGSGRIGALESPMSLREFAELVAHTLPETAHGVRVAGDPDQVIETVALCGGAGDFLLDRARAKGADVYLTSDLRHHPASESREHGQTGMALVDVAHWAAEWMWLPTLRRKLAEALGDTVEVRVSTINTDPWTFRV